MARPRRFFFPDSQAGCSHVVSRVVGKAMILGDVEKEVLTDMMHALAAFHHVEVLTYCMMTNHFHILVRVPERPDGFDMTLDEVMEKWSRAVGTAWRTGVQRLFEINDLNGSRERAEEEWRKRMLGRMFSHSGGYTESVPLLR